MKSLILLQVDLSVIPFCVIVPDDTLGFLDMRIHSYTFYIGKDLGFSSMFSS